jgi:hypothetical protein
MIVTSRGILPDVEPTSLGLALPAPSSPLALPADEDLLALARSFKIQPEGWRVLAPFLAFDARQYRRVRLFRSENWEGLLLCWLPGQRTAVHDHGGSVGVSTILSGRITEMRYSAPVGAGGNALKVSARAECSAGTTAIEFLETIHEMANESSEPAVSLHLYCRPLRILGAWDTTSGQRWEVPVGESPDVQVGGDPKLHLTEYP